MKNLTKKIIDSGEKGELVYEDFLSLSIHLKAVYFTAQFHRFGPQKMLQLILSEGVDPELLADVEINGGVEVFNDRLRSLELRTEEMFEAELHIVIAKFLEYCTSPENDWNQLADVKNFLDVQEKLVRLDEKCMQVSLKETIERCTAMNVLTFVASEFELSIFDTRWQDCCEDSDGNYRDPQVYRDVIKTFDRWLYRDGIFKLVSYQRRREREFSPQKHKSTLQLEKTIHQITQILPNFLC